jgi:hypothetical protein
MEKKGKFPCRSPVCSVFAGDHGRAQRESWMRSLGCLASTQHGIVNQEEEEAPADHYTLYHAGAPSSSYQDNVLLRHILETPLHGRAGIDLHLGQKPKLGGGTLMIHSSTYHILSVLCISMFRFLFFVVLILISAFQNVKKTKNISVVSLCLPF